MDIQAHEPAPATSTAVPGRRPKHPTLVQELEQLHRRHGRDIHKFMIRNGVMPADAEVLVNWTFYAVYRAMQSNGGHLDEPRPYLYKVASNLMKGHWRDHHRAPEFINLHQLEETEDPRLGRHDDTSRVEDLDELVLTQAALNALPARQREAFVLRHYYDFPPQEIATVMGISVETVDTHLERARRKLADLTRKEAS